jgi:hypothetical protein
MNDKATSKKAFQLLHQQYPNSSEAGRTRYYYEDILPGQPRGIRIDSLHPKTLCAL